MKGRLLFCLLLHIATTKACGHPAFFPQTCPHLSKVFSYTMRTFFVARLPTGLLAHWHDSTHTSGRATGGLFYIKQYGNTPTGRKMSNKDTRALPCYYAITYHPFLTPLPTPFIPSCARYVFFEPLAT